MRPGRRPIRVVAFFGPFLRSTEEFLARLDAHPEIDLVAGFCQAAGGGARERVRDLVRRRGPLALLYLAAVSGATATRWLARPSREIAHRRAMARLGPRLSYVPDLHAPQVLDRIRGLAPDVGAIYGAPILRPELFGIPRLGTLGIHHGRLPEYRGKKTTFWEMYCGEESAGVTIQRVNAGIDTGEVVARAAVPVGRRGYARVWGEVQRTGIELFVRAILDVGRGTARPEPAAGPRGPLRSDPKAGDLMRLWWRRRFGRRG